MRFGFRALPIGYVFLALVVVAACGQAPPPETGAPANPLAGAWSVTAIELADGSVIDPAQPGLFIFAEGYYSTIYTNRAEPRPLSATPFDATDEEALDQFRSIIVNTGTYTVSGSMITFRPLVARAPEFIGGESTAEFELAGDVLTLRYKTIVAADGGSPTDVGGWITLRRG